MFGSPNVRIRLQSTQENTYNVAAQKANVLKTIKRQPLGDRSVNKKSPVVQQTKPFIKEDVQDITELPEWLADKCSYLEVMDSYEDIWPTEEREEFLKSVLSAVFPKIQEPTLNIECFSNKEDWHIPDNPQLGLNIEELFLISNDYLEVEDVPLPDLSF